MPGVDGLALVRQYRADSRTKNIPIIVLSSREEGAVKSQAFTAGANDYLVKLPDVIELIARIRYHSQSYLNQVQRDEVAAVVTGSLEPPIPSATDEITPAKLATRHPRNYARAELMRRVGIRCSGL